MAEEAAAVSFRRRRPVGPALRLLWERRDRRLRRDLRQEDRDHFGHRATSGRYLALSVYGEVGAADTPKPSGIMRSNQDAVRLAFVGMSALCRFHRHAYPWPRRDSVV